MNANIVFLCIIIFIFIVHLMLSAEVGFTAERMNRSFGLWMLLALIISPFITAIFVHCLGPIPVLKKKKEEDNETKE